jgi:hypothetical protein
MSELALSPRCRTVVERDGLFDEWEKRAGRKLNQPAGHLEPAETLRRLRHAAGETGWRVMPTALIGIYRWRPRIQGPPSFDSHRG